MALNGTNSICNAIPFDCNLWYSGTCNECPQLMPDPDIAGIGVFRIVFLAFSPIGHCLLPHHGWSYTHYFCYWSDFGLYCKRRHGLQPVRPMVSRPRYSTAPTSALLER